MDIRKKREKKIHNEFFDKDTRGKLSFFYSLTKSSISFYENSLVKNCSGKKVLDYGCGRGDRTLFLSENGAEVTGIDISEEGIERAQEMFAKEFENVEFLVMDGEKMSFPDDTFDIVCGIGILHHLNLDFSLKEIKRVLKPSGKAIFLEPLGYNPFLNLFRKFTPALRTPDEHPLLMRDIRKAYNYFDKIDLRFFHFLSFLAIPFRKTRIFYNVLNVLDKLDKKLFKIFPPFRLLAWIIVIEFSQPK